MNLPNLKHLQYLLALHQHHHFNRAAKACFVSQSTLSSAILKLEEQLGCQLVERDHKAFIFTPHGIRIVDMARKLLVSANELVSYAQQQGDPISGSIRIGCIHTIAPYLLTDFVLACQQKMPQLSLYLREDTTDNLMRMLGDGEIDTVILALPIVEHGFTCKTLGKDIFNIAGDKSLVTAFNKTGDYTQLPEQSVFLLSQEHCLTEHAVSACHLADPKRINPFSASSLTTLVQMTAFHKGVTFLPDMAVNKGIGREEGLTINKLSNEMYRDIGILWRKTSMRQQLFMKIVGILKPLLN
jgi:LysR family hydrogen peroxide-inducible transcriptional activator